MRRFDPGAAAWATTIGFLLLCVSPAVAQDETLEAAQAHRNELLDRATDLAREQQRLEPLADGETRALKAVVMETKGRCQWRTDDQAAWQTAKTDDLLDPGAEIRTALRSTIAVRLGQNGSLLVGQSSRVVLPDLSQEGGTLVTTVQITRGRADFKVDKVGLTNDFSIVTPSTTLSVRGSSVRVQYGGLMGTETFASPTNELDAIEVQYFLTKLTAYLSGAAVTSDNQPDPVMAALFKSVGPPSLISAFLQSLLQRAAELGEEELLKALIGAVYEDYQSTIDAGDIFACTLTEAARGEGLMPLLIGPLPPTDQPPVSPCDICEGANLAQITSQWAFNMVFIFGIFDTSNQDDVEAFQELQGDLFDLCNPPDPFEFGQFFDEINRFCSDHTSNPALCVELFNQAAVDHSQ
jgi:hypothetical protein